MYPFCELFTYLTMILSIDNVFCLSDASSGSLSVASVDIESRLMAIEKDISNAKRDEKLLEAKLDDGRRERIVLENSIANLTHELERERNIRLDLERTLNTTDSTASDGSQLLLLIGDLQQQVLLMKASNDLTRTNTSLRELSFQKQLHQISLSLFELSNTVRHDAQSHKGMFQMINSSLYKTNSAIDTLNMTIDEVKNASLETRYLMEMTQYSLNSTLTDIDDIYKSLNNSNEKIKVLKVFKQGQQVQNSILDSMNSTIIDVQETLQRMNEDKKTDVDDKEFFSALLSNFGQYTNYSYHKLPYGREKTKHGIGYDFSTGIFTAPSSGYFVFFWDIHVSSGKLCDTALMKNGDYMLSATADARGGSGTQMASALQILHLNQGDKVWVETGVCESFYAFRYGSFSGWRLA